MADQSPQPADPRRPRAAAAPPRLTRAVVELEQHVAAGGWDQPVRLFALVPTAELLAAQPDLADQLGGDALLLDPGHLTPVEQEVPAHDGLEELLAGIVWPPEVAGTAVAVERLVLPPDAEGALPDDPAAAAAFAAGHPGRQEVRLAVGVLRDGSRECAVRLRSADRDQDVRSGADLVPGLARALAATLED
ncbi:PPA1309 family protein [Vallicoccus soli]|uniref:Uncharacterized protein n=1 Tax=Vallicoccus soli TaxID=2339232 RepID=A0A3A3Z543_9ACTN|nr:PPA1309 family protein [Vallicoccus soli]RJK98093.1 hypothetical protein D5H78_03950 [Vallicoccus soli]